MAGYKWLEILNNYTNKKQACILVTVIRHTREYNLDFKYNDGHPEKGY